MTLKHSIYIQAVNFFFSVLCGWGVFFSLTFSYFFSDSFLFLSFFLSSFPVLVPLHSEVLLK